MGTERADDKAVPEEEVLSRETRDAKEVGSSEVKTTSMSNPPQLFEKLLTLGYTSHSVTFRNRYMVTVPGLYEETASLEHATAFVLNTTFLELFVCSYWFKSNKVIVSTKWNDDYPFVSFGNSRIKISRQLPSTKQATVGVNSIDKAEFDEANCMLIGISKDGYPNEIHPIKKLSTYNDICSRGTTIGTLILTPSSWDALPPHEVLVEHVRPPPPPPSAVISQDDEKLKKYLPPLSATEVDEVLNSIPLPQTTCLNTSHLPNGCEEWPIQRKVFLHEGVAEKINTERPLEGDILSTRCMYWTCILRGYERTPINIGCLYVEHEDHIHFVFESTNDISRKVDNLINN
ncbi:unnamed protein product [Hymenolepis diminuta]|uniref:Uncharacterized protein n=1 Tax=Hymenolepis diminuta TaxID=6216 RepID=A0A564YLQ2_HYMDI|nr:unnamed protein product [Hymenolepis diminuta]